MKKIIAFLCFVVLLISCIKTAPLPDLAPSPLISVNSLLMNSADTNWVHLSIIYPYKDSSSIKKAKPVYGSVDIEVDGKSIEVFQIGEPGFQEQFGFTTPLLPGQTVSATFSSPHTSDAHCEVVIPEPVQDSDIISFNATEAIPSNNGGSSEFNAYAQKINIDLVFRSSIAETYDIILECETESGRVLEGRITPPTINSRQNYYLYAAFSSYYGIEAYGAAYGLSFQDDDFKEGDTIHLTGSVSIHLYQGDRVKSVWPVIGTGSKELYKHIRSIYARRSNDFKDWGVTSPVTTYTNIDNGYGYFLARSRSEFKSRRVML